MLTSWTGYYKTTATKTEPGPYDRILHMHVEIRVTRRRAIQIYENILIYNADPTSVSGFANEIRYGLIRYIPVRFKLGPRLNRATPIAISEIRRNGKKENWALYETGNAAKIMIGSSSRYLDEGFHHYELRYEIDNALSHNEKFDEIYWNITGQNWTMPIGTVSSKVFLPASPLSYRLYSGKQGDTTTGSASILKLSDTVIYIQQNNPVLPGNGITTAVSFKSGLIDSPKLFDKLKFIFIANKYVFVLPLAAVLLFLLGLWAWLLKGREKTSDVIYPLFEPPLGFAPAELGFIAQQGHHIRHTIASLADLALKGQIIIRVNKEPGLFPSTIYHIIPNESDTSQGIEYSQFLNETGIPRESVIKKGEYSENLARFDSSIKNFNSHKYLEKENSNPMWIKLNHKMLIPGNVILFIGFLLSFWWFVKEPLPNPWGVLYAGAGMFTGLIIQGIWYKLMPNYGKSGKQLLQKIEGFRLYLTMAEENEMNLMNVPEKSPDLYYRYLPYAIALNCELEWSERFKDILSKTIIKDLNVHHINRSFFSYSSIGAFGSTITSAASPPSSGSGGASFSGGSAGGGAGGGGGSGW